MADKKDKKPVEPEVEEKDTEQPEPKKPSKKKLIMIIGGIVLIVVVLGAGGYILSRSMSAPSEASEDATAQSDDSAKDKSKGEDAIENTGIYFSDFDAFITVLGPSEEYKFTYLKFVPKFEMSNKDVSSELVLKLPLVEDKINAVMTDLQWATIKSEKGRERQAEKLKDKLNEFLESGEVIKVYFTTFVAQ